MSHHHSLSVQSFVSMVGSIPGAFSRSRDGGFLGCLPSVARSALVALRGHAAAPLRAAALGTRVPRLVFTKASCRPSATGVPVLPAAVASVLGRSLRRLRRHRVLGGSMHRGLPGGASGRRIAHRLRRGTPASAVPGSEALVGQCGHATRLLLGSALLIFFLVAPSGTAI